MTPTERDSEYRDIVYRLDDQDHIVFLNDEWDQFAAANAGESIASHRVLYRSLWDFVTDINTREIYRHALVRSRGGQRLRFCFRCDSPSRRRLLEMTIGRGPDETTEFRTHLLTEEARTPQPLLEATAPRSSDLIRMCGWCKKVFVGGGWKEVEEAVSRLALFERPVMPGITHGICESCYETMMERLAKV
jgi:hypothetical protein